MSGERTYITYLRNEGAPGLLLWSDAHDVPSRLKSSFGRGKWVRAVELLLPRKDLVLARQAVEGWWLRADHAVEELASIALNDLRRFSHAARVWILAAKWAVFTIDRQQLVPALRAAPDDAGWRATWRVAPVQAEDRTGLAALAEAMPGIASASAASPVRSSACTGATRQVARQPASSGVARSAGTSCWRSIANTARSGRPRRAKSMQRIISTRSKPRLIEVGGRSSARSVM